MPSPRLLKWLHRIGYVCTALIVAELAALTYFYVGFTLQQHARITKQMDETRTRDGRVMGGDRVRDQAVALLAPLPPLDSLGSNGFHFVAVPQLSRFHYALSLQDHGGDAQGILIVTERLLNSEETHPTTQRFVMPRGAFISLMAAIDREADGYAGIDSAGHCMDGTTIAFERVRARRITSGIGNGGCFAHYRAISDTVRAAILPIVIPSGPRLRDGWYPAE